MYTHILATKLFIPPPRPKALSRPRLIERLNEGLHGKLTLIVAPAGFGKTTLAGAWIAAGKRPAAWLSLDEGDGNPARFLAYLVAALQTVAPELGERLLGSLQSPQPPPIEAILTALLNEIASTPRTLILVLDDYHVVDSNAVDQAITFLLKHLPPQMHLVIITREDPQLPLARLRAQGQMTEVRAADLRFAPSEAAGFLNEVMGLNLTVEEVNALEARTEGWIAALQLAALSMRGREETARFVRAFAGDNRYIVDYLIEEVLQRQPEHVRTFLLETSILDRLSGPLCDAVTGRDDGTLLLDALERSSFFVVPLDDKCLWFRYHHLFAAVLAAHAQQEEPARIPLLHQRASAWCAANGLPGDAIRHALAAEDFARAADLIEPAIPAMRRSRQEATVLGWLRMLPDELLRARPVLSVYFAGILLQSGELEDVEARLRDAERWLDTTADMAERSNALPQMVVVDHEEFRRLPGSIAIYRAGGAVVRGNVQDALQFARQALELLPDDDDLGRGSAATLLGLAYWTSGDLDTAHQMYAEGMPRLLRAGHLSDLIGCTIALADILLAQGRLHSALRIYAQGLQLAAGGGGPILRGAADMHVGMSELYRERGDLQAAAEQLQSCDELGEHAGLGQNPYRRRVAMARARMLYGDLDGAVALLQEAERLYMGDFSPNVHPVAALKTRVWLAQGRLDEALGWARAQGLSAHDDLSYLREFEHITLARVLMVQAAGNRPDRTVRPSHLILEAMGLLDRLLGAAEAGKRVGSVIEILIVQALAHHAQGDASAALAPLERALALAEPEGYVRIFVDEGPSMAQLLRYAAAHEIMPAYVGRLLAAFETASQPGARSASRLADRAAQPLVEPLSQRELDVLRLFQTELSGPEIARELVIALSTLRTHTKSIYSKLNVNSRRAAVNQAVELGLI